MSSINLDVEEVSDFYENMEDSQEVNGKIPGAENLGSDPGEFGEAQVLEQLNKTLTNICRTANNIAVENGFKGLGEIPPEDYAELMGIVIKRNFSSVIVEKSPEVALASVTAMVVLQNVSAMKAKNNKNKGGENGNC